MTSNVILVSVYYRVFKKCLGPKMAERVGKGVYPQVFGRFKVTFAK